MDFSDLSELYIGGNEVQELQIDGQVVWTKVQPEPPPADAFYFEAVDGDVTVKMVKTLTTVTVRLESSIGTSWNKSYNCYSDTTIPQGSKLYLRAQSSGNTRTGENNIRYNNFVFGGSGKVKCCGNIMYLLNKTPSLTLTQTFAFSNLFLNCTSLIAAPQLPAMTLTNSCYYQIFSGCTSLTTPPVLPATTLASGCYTGMFKNCTSLITAPQLQATTLAELCYKWMFQGCTSLITAPQLPATTLANGCYMNLFAGCTSLKYIDVNFTAWSPTYATEYWFRNTGTGTSDRIFRCNASLPQTRGENYIPEGWTIQTK